MKVRLPAGTFNLVGLNFRGIGATNNTLQAVLGDQLLKSNVPTLADRVHIYDTVNSVYVQYAVRLSDGLFHYFTNYAGPAVNPIIPNGQAFWIQSPSTVTTDRFIYVMGEVPDVTNTTRAIVGTGLGYFQQIGNPYPVDADVNTLIGTNDGAKANNVPTLADRMFLWQMDQTNYVQVGLRASDGKWHYFTNFAGPAVSNVFLAPGAAAWYRGLTNFTWNEPKPYTYP